LLLDEPMSALDARLRDRLRRTIREIQSSLSITTLYVTHDQAEALSVSDRIAVMRDGRVEQVGPPEAVYAEPSNPFVAGFVGENNLFEVQSIDGSTATLACGVDVSLPGIEPGQTISVRPEAFTVRSAGAGAAGPSLEATVESAAFQGGRYTLTCRVGDRTVLVDADRAPDGAVELGFDPAALQVFSDRAGER
jgi:thiamine transport system ATP-binding protein